MNVYRHVLRPALFRCDPERVHNLAIDACQVAGKIAPARWLANRLWARGGDDPRLASDIHGLHFANPIGLAAGYDKSGKAVRFLETFGFGYLEIGSISADASTGNPRPRLWRLVEDEAILVHYGLPNDGADAIAARLAQTRLQCPLGVNVVKTNRGIEAPPETLDEVLADYRRSVETLMPYADYLMINLSCPNTEMGRDLFAGPLHVRALLTQLAGLAINRPLFLKVSPLGGEAARDDLLEVCSDFGFVSGFAFNLSAQRPVGLSGRADGLPGAVAGPPIREQMNACMADLYRRMDRERYHIIGIGGVRSAEDAYEKIRLGASLVQLLTGLIYHGPSLVTEIRRGLAHLLERDGFHSVTEATGSAHNTVR